MTPPARVALLVTAWVLGAGLSATATTAAVAAVAGPPPPTAIATTSLPPVENPDDEVDERTTAGANISIPVER